MVFFLQYAVEYGTSPRCARSRAISVAHNASGQKRATKKASADKGKQKLHPGLEAGTSDFGLQRT